MLKFLKDVELGKVLGAGIAGVVVEGFRPGSLPTLAIKFLILDQQPYVFGQRGGFKCRRGFLWFFKILARLEWNAGGYPTQFAAPITTQDFRNEASLARKASKHNIGPKVYYSAVCEKGLDTALGDANLGMLAMEKYDLTLSKWLKTLKPLDDSAILQWVQIAHSVLALAKKALPIIKYHGDLHAANVVLKRRKSKSVVRFIDFGFHSTRRGDIVQEAKKLVSESEINTEIIEFREKRGHMENDILMNLRKFITDF